MSAITEYIHYNQKNYDIWGINRPNTIKSDTMSASFEQTRNRITNIDQLNKLLLQSKKIEEDYNQLFFPSKETQFSRLLAEVAQETLYEQFGAAAGMVDKTNFDVKQDQLSTNYKNKVEAVKKKINVANLADDATAKQILNRINKLSTVLLNLEDAKNSDVLKSRLKNARNELHQIKNKIQKQINLKNINFSEDISTINKLIQEFNRSFTWYNQRGDLFEWLLPLIQLKSTSLTGQELKKAMKELVGSSNEGATKVSISFADFLNMPEKNLSIDIKSEKFEMQIADVRSKTDVRIKYAVGNQQQVKDFAVSAKSVTGRHVKLVEETSLYRILVFSQNYDFIKHYLNIISESKESKASEEQIVKANRLVKGLVMQLAAQGFDLNNPSQLLIMHDVQAKKINVYNIKALVYLIQQQIINGNNKYNNLIKTSNNSSSFEDDFTIKQEFEETVEQRLNFLFNEINKIKVTAYIYATQLNSYLKILNKI